jgi:uroporphyrin-3 C-methyltransferase
VNANELETEPNVAVEEPSITKPAEQASRSSATPPGGAPPEHQANGSSSALVWLAMLLAAAALLLAAWMWWQGDQSARQQQQALQDQQQQYLDELKRLESSLAAAQDASSRQSSELGSGLQQRLQALEAAQNAGADFRSETTAWTRSAQAALEESQARLNSLDEKLRTLSARSAESDTELELEEIDYLLRMAQERLELFGDTRTADRALQLADQQVLAFDNPMFIALRRDIAAARRALAAADVPDMVTLGAELDGVQDSLSQLPFRSGSEQAATTNDSAGETVDLPWWERLKNTLSGLVTVRRVADDELAMPVLADQLALRQRAWLQIEQARLAALSREQSIYQDSLAQAEATIRRWFTADDPQVKLAISSLQSLQQRNIDPPMPDISAPWNTLRSLRNAGLSPAPVETPASDSVDETVSEPVDGSDVDDSDTSAAGRNAVESSAGEDAPAIESGAESGTGTDSGTDSESDSGSDSGQDGETEAGIEAGIQTGRADA